MDHGCEALIGFVGAQGDPLELFEFAEEVFDEVTRFVDFHVDVDWGASSWVLGDDDSRAALLRSATIQSVSKALSAIKPPNSTPSISGATPTVSKRCPGINMKRTRLPSASVRARILVVQPPLDLPMAWPGVPLLRPDHDGEP